MSKKNGKNKENTQKINSQFGKHFSGKHNLSKDRKHLLASFLKKKILSSSIMFFLLVLNTQSYACLCAGTLESIEEIYNNADGIYYVVISSITQSSDTYQGRFKSVVNLEIELTIFNTYKGDEFGTILAKGTGRLPYYNENGQLERGGSSCDRNFTFGDYYVIIKNKDEIVDLGLCSKNILEQSK